MLPITQKTRRPVRRAHLSASHRTESPAPCWQLFRNSTEWASGPFLLSSFCRGTSQGNLMEMYMLDLYLVGLAFTVKNLVPCQKMQIF